MTIEDDDVNKLLGQIKLPDFPYRAFGRGEGAPLKIVRSANATEVAAAAVPVNKQPPVTSTTNSAAPAQGTTLKAASVPVVVRPASASATARSPSPVGAAFERLARVALPSSAPRLQLQLNLSPRPPLAKEFAAPASSAHLKDVFRRLAGTVVSHAKPGQMAGGNEG